MVPLMNFVVYPALRRRKINFSPIKRICFGFFLCTIQMVIAAILQWRVYETSPCGTSSLEGVVWGLDCD